MLSSQKSTQTNLGILPGNSKNSAVDLKPPFSPEVGLSVITNVETEAQRLAACH